MRVQPNARGVGVATGIQDQRNAVGLVASEMWADTLRRRRAAKDLGHGIQRLVEKAALVCSGTKHANQCGFRTRSSPGRSSYCRTGFAAVRALMPRSVRSQESPLP